MPPYVFTEDWFSNNIPMWKSVLGHLPSAACHALEIGSFQGRSAVWLLENALTHPGSTLTCIDTFRGSDEHTVDQVNGMFEVFTSNIDATGRSSDVRVLAQNSTVALASLLPRGPCMNFVYVDGDHHASQVLLDAAMAFELLVVGGIMIFDDYMWGDTEGDSVKRGVDAWLHANFKRASVLFSGYQLGVVKLA